MRFYIFAPQNGTRCENSRYSYFLQLEQFDEQLPQLQLPLDDFFIFLKIIYPEAITKIAVIIISK